jgi:nucleoside-diphosphate-sugar epimerase
MRVLIIGCGYVGLPLGVELVRRGHTVFGLRRSATPIPPAAGVETLRADIARAESLAGLPRDFDWVVNCAASGGGGEDEYRRLYVGGNRNLVSWLSGNPPRKFIYTSSTGVYGQTDGSVVTEDSPTQPGAATAAALVEAEQLLRDASKIGFPAVVLRLAGIYGPGRGHAFQQFLRGGARIEGDGSRFMNMVHRDDVLGAIIAALERGEPGETYNVVDDEPVSQRAFFTWLAAQLNRPLPAVVPADDGLGRKRGLTNKRVSNARLRTRLAYQFNYPNFRAGYAALLPSQPDGLPLP